MRTMRFAHDAHAHMTLTVWRERRTPSGKSTAPVWARAEAFKSRLAEILRRLLWCERGCTARAADTALCSVCLSRAVRRTLISECVCAGSLVVWTVVSVCYRITAESSVVHCLCRRVCCCRVWRDRTEIVIWRLCDFIMNSYMFAVISVPAN